MNVLLILIAFILVFIFGPIGVVYNLLFNWKARKKYFFSIALSLDQLGNVICSGLLNFIMIKGEGVKFGNVDETVSSVLGKNKAKGTLTLAGRHLCFVLNEIQENHVENAIEADEN